MNQMEFENKFKEFMASNDLEATKKDCDFEWDLFLTLQNDLSRAVSFEEYFELVETDWMVVVAEIEAEKVRKREMFNAKRRRQQKPKNVFRGKTGVSAK